MNWGTKILVVYIAFVLGIVFMVFKSSSQKTDLVTKDYYAQELKYQEKIDESKRVAALSAPVTCNMRDRALIISFPKDFAGKTLAGEAVLYCPSDEKKDIKKSFSVVNDVVQIAIPAGSNGLYELHITWQENGTGYYFEKKIFI